MEARRAHPSTLHRSLSRLLESHTEKNEVIHFLSQGRCHHEDENPLRGTTGRRTRIIYITSRRQARTGGQCTLRNISFAAAQTEMRAVRGNKCAKNMSSKKPMKATDRTCLTNGSLSLCHTLHNPDAVLS